MAAALFSALILHAVAPIHAQTIPQTVQPGIPERELEQPVEPKSDRSIVIPKPSADEPPKGAETVQFALKSVTITGGTVFHDDVLASVYQDFLGEDITLAAVFAMANQITQLYANAGYALSIGFVPAQEIEDGHVRISIAEGFVSEIEIEGDGWFPKKLLAKFAEKIEASRPLRRSVLERYLLLANDLPGLSVKSVFAPIPGEVGATKLILKATQNHFGAAVTVNDRGSKALGRERVGANAGVNSPLGRGGRLGFNYLRMFDDKELSVYAFGAAMPIGSEGTSAGVNIIYSEAEPGTDLLQLIQFKSEGFTGIAHVAHPFIRSRSRNLFGSVEFTTQDLSSVILGAENSDDQINFVKASLNFDWLDQWGGISLIGASISQGIDIFGTTSNSSPTKSRAAGKFNFTALNMRLYRLQDLGGPFDAALSVDGQYAADPLLASLQCGYGGNQYGRGFDGFQLSGDHCVNASAEIRWHIDTSWLSFVTLQAYGFYDAGFVWRRGAVLPGEYREEEGQSTGVGMRFSLGQKIGGSVEYAKPLEETVALEGNKNGRVFLSLGASF
jgi:hemolysin activation/secretion protein